MKRIISILLALALVLGFSLVATTPVAAAILTVDTGQADTPPNYWTIQAAIDAASSGDTINVAAGTYTEYLHITTDGLTIQGAGIDQSIIDLDGLEPYWHYTGSSFASRAGVLISGYLSPGIPAEVVENVTFKGFTVKNAGLNPPITDSGTHDGGDNQAILTDSTATWTPGALVGEWVHNYGDRDSDYNPLRSYGQITANTATTVTATLSGGKENDWDNGDRYVITSYNHYYDGWESPGQESIPGIAIHNGKNVLIQNCKVENSGKYGISAGKARSTSLTQSEDVTIDSCVVLDNADNGISVGDHIGTVTITDNTCTNNGCPHIADATREYQGTGIQVTGSSSSKKMSGSIADNTCSGSFIGIHMAKWIDGVTVEGNTVTGCNRDEDGAGIFFYYYGYPDRCKNVIVRDNTVTGNIRGIVAYYASDSTIEGNTITTDSGSFAEGQGAIKIDRAHNITVRDNTISCDGTGITISSYDSGSNSYGNLFTGNTIIGAKFAGVLIYGPYARDNTFTSNTITGTTSLTLWAGTAWEETQADGVFIDDDAGTGNVFHCNNIYGNGDDGMENQITATVDAENNWWGCDAGPGGGGCDTVVGNVDYDPWVGASSVATATGTGTASFAAACCGSIINLTSESEGSLPAAAQATKPIGFPDGLFSFDITGLSNGQTVTVTITLPAGSAPTQYWKYHASEGGWIQIPMTVVGPPNVITITLVDGGLGDDDLTANGVIVDQGGPGGGAVGWETNPVSKVRVLAPWIALGAAIVAGASLLVLRRRRAQS